LHRSLGAKPRGAAEPSKAAAGASAGCAPAGASGPPALSAQKVRLAIAAGIPPAQFTGWRAESRHSKAQAAPRTSSVGLRGQELREKELLAAAVVRCETRPKCTHAVSCLVRKEKDLAKYALSSHYHFMMFATKISTLFFPSTVLGEAFCKI